MYSEPMVNFSFLTKVALNEIFKTFTSLKEANFYLLILISINIPILVLDVHDHSEKVED